MKDLAENKNNVIDLKLLFSLLGLVFFFNAIILKKYGEDALIVLVVEILVLASATIYFTFKKSIAVYFILIYFLQFLLLSNEFHYSFVFEFILSLPLLFLIFLTWLGVLSKGNPSSIKLSRFGKVILLFVSYSFIMAFIGKLGGRDGYNIFIEWYHLFYYAYFFVFLFFLKEREDYHLILSFLLVVAIIISIEYVFIGFFLLNDRFVTFQSNFLPIVAGFLLTSIFFRYKRRISFMLLGIVLAGMVATQSRSLWIVTVIVIITTMFFYMKIKGSFSFKKMLLLLLICLLPFFMLGDSSKSKAPPTDNTGQIEHRVESLSDPTSDNSFLMRIEATYYAIKKFSESPIWGKGFGDDIKLVITGNKDLELNYIDNTWAYLLWKGGLISFVLFVLMIYFFARRLYYVAQNTNDIRTKIITIGLLSGIVGMVVLGLVSPHLIKYKSNVLFPFLFAYSEVEFKNIFKKS